MIADELQFKSDLVEDIGGFYHDPLGFAKYAFPWGEGELGASAGPRPWQHEVLDYIGAWLRNPVTRFQPCEITIASGHGIGKSALMGMVIAWGLSTREDTRIVATANTDTQLTTKTVPEVCQWMRRSINADWWDIAARSIKSSEAKYADSWRCDFIPWNERKPEAFAGLHNAGKRIILLYDEASAIPAKIWEVSEGALTDENTEIIWLRFGNPTRNDGRFREYFGSRKSHGKTFQIDSRTVDGTNKIQIEKWRAAYGEDSDFFRVKVRGEFPRAGIDQFIAQDTVADCRRYKAEGFQQFPKVLGVDVARFGDDQTVIIERQGRRARVLGRYRGLDTAVVTAHVIEFIESEKVEAIVVDSDGIGNTVYDQLKFQGYGRQLVEFHGGRPAINQQMYFNRRAEIWGATRDWLKAGAEIPDEPELETDLTGPTYGFSPQQQIQLEKKDDMKARGLSSPDLGDALAMTFAVRLAPNVPSAPEPHGEYGADSWMA